MDDRIKGLIRIEQQCAAAAREALEARTPRTRRKYIKQLFGIASSNIDRMEVGAIPSAVAEEHLELAISRINYPVFSDEPQEIIAGEPLDLARQLMLSNLSEAQAMLGRVVAKNS